jgi:predicted nucleic acid-binding protein
VIVLDASAALELVLVSANGEVVTRRIADAEESLHAPHLLLVEATQALRRLVRTGTISEVRASEALDDLANLDSEYYEHEPLLGRIWQLRDNLTAYDASYVALAEALDAPLLTFDEKLANAPGNHATIELLGGG